MSALIRAGGTVAMQGARRLWALPAEDRLTARLLGRSGSWFDYLTGVTTPGGTALQTWVDRVMGRTVSDGGVSTRRPGYNASTGLTLDGVTDYLVGCANIGQASPLTILVLGTVTAPAVAACIASYGSATSWVEMIDDVVDGPTARLAGLVWEASAVKANGLTALAPGTHDVWACVFNSGATPVKALHRNSGGDLILTRPVNGSAAAFVAGDFYIGARPSGAIPAAMTDVTDVIVIPHQCTQAEVAEIAALLREHRELSQYLQASQVSDSAVAVPGRLFDRVSEYAMWEGPTNLQPGDVIEITSYTSQAAGTSSFGVQENDDAIVSYGNASGAPSPPTFAKRTNTHTIVHTNPRLRLINGVQAWQASKPILGTYCAEVLLPSGRRFAPSTKVATRRLVAMVDSIGSGQESADYVVGGIAAYLRANYPGRVTFFGAGAFGFAPAATDAGGAAASGTAAKALLNGTAINECWVEVGTNDWVLWAAAYANTADFRAKMASFWTALFTSPPVGFAAWYQTIGPRTAGIPSTLGTVAQCRTAEQGAVSDAGVAATYIDGDTQWTLSGSSDLLHPTIAQQAAYATNMRAAMGTW